LQNQLEISRRDCEWALREFEELEEERGVGLACIALGNNFRLQGSFAGNGKEQYNAATEFYSKSEEFLRRAIGIFSDQIQEPLRLWEAYNELGCLMREWGIALQRQTQEPFATDKFEEAIRTHEQALEVARRYGLLFQEADTCDDLAYVWSARGDLVVAQQWLDQVFALVPATYVLKNEQGFQDAPASGDAHWLILGKAHWRQMLWSLPSVEQTNLSKRRRAEVVRTALQHLVLAYAYFERYCKDAPALHLRLQRIAEQLIRLGLLSDQSRRIMNKFAAHYGIDVKGIWKHLVHSQTIVESPARS